MQPKAAGDNPTWDPFPSFLRAFAGNRSHAAKGGVDGTGIWAKLSGMDESRAARLTICPNGREMRLACFDKTQIPLASRKSTAKVATGSAKHHLILAAMRTTQVWHQDPSMRSCRLSAHTRMLSLTTNP
jgi:hypothetical protein